MCKAILKKLGQIMKNKIVTGLVKYFLHHYQEKKETLKNESNLLFDNINLFSYPICKNPFREKQ